MLVCTARILSLLFLFSRAVAGRASKSTSLLGKRMASSWNKSFVIEKTWDGKPVDHSPVKLCLEAEANSSAVVLSVDAPFFNDPQSPPAASGEACDQLWDYEVVEAFFLGTGERYLEVELCPHGQHLVLTLEGVRKIKHMKLPLEFSASCDSTKSSWTGRAVIPADYFPTDVHLFNAYAIHGSGDARTYESLYPAAPAQFEQPDFHRLQFFQAIDFPALKKSDGKSKWW